MLMAHPTLRDATGSGIEQLQVNLPPRARTNPTPPRLSNCISGQRPLERFIYMSI